MHGDPRSVVHLRERSRQNGHSPLVVSNQNVRRTPESVGEVILNTSVQYRGAFLSLLYAQASPQNMIAPRLWVENQLPGTQRTPRRARLPANLRVRREKRRQRRMASAHVRVLLSSLRGITDTLSGVRVFTTDYSVPGPGLASALASMSHLGCLSPVHSTALSFGLNSSALYPWLEQSTSHSQYG